MPVNAVHTAARERVQIVRGPSWRLLGRHLWRVSVCVCVLACRCVFVDACVFFRLRCLCLQDASLFSTISRWACAIRLSRLFPCVHTCTDAHKQTRTPPPTHTHTHIHTHTYKHTQGRAWSRCLWNTRPDRYCNGGGKWGMWIELINYCLQCLSIHLSVHPIIDIIKQNYISML